MRYDPQAGDKYDPPARTKGLEVVPDSLRAIDPQRFGDVWLKSNPNRFGVDLLGITQNGERFDVEVEIKTDERWVDTFPFRSGLNILARKMKFAAAAHPVFFVIFNFDLTRWGIVLNHTLMMLPRQTTYTQNRGEDVVFCVPLEYVHFFPQAPVP